jgi:hypothetical protein
MDREEDDGARLERLGRATDAVRPSAGFNRRVMAAIEAEQPAFWLADLPRLARRFVPVAALAAACAVVWAVQSDSALEDAMATSADAVELEW